MSVPPSPPSTSWQVVGHSGHSVKAHQPQRQSQWQAPQDSRKNVSGQSRFKEGSRKQRPSTEAISVGTFSIAVGTFSIAG